MQQKNMETHLKPCPFCGDLENHELQTTAAFGTGPAYRRICGQCGTQTARWNKPVEAIRAWNRRPAPAAAWVAIEGAEDGMYWITEMVGLEATESPEVTNYELRNGQWGFDNGDGFYPVSPKRFVARQPYNKPEPYRPAVEAERILTPDA